MFFFISAVLSFRRIKMLNINKIVVGAFDVNCYLVWTRDLDALIIDPGADAEAILKIINHYRLKVRAYLITHGHIDHISALDGLWARAKAPIAMHAADARWAFAPANQMPPYYPAPVRQVDIEQVLKGGEKLEEAGLSYEVIATPRHSPGGVCYYFPGEDTLFSGDTLFRDTVGRTDFPGGNMKQLTDSLHILAALPPRTKVYPGHGPETTIAREIECNPFLTSR